MANGCLTTQSELKTGWNSAEVRIVLAMAAQEEFAKAFLLCLVRDGILPWSCELVRAMNDHACKHLVGILIEYCDPHCETIEELRDIYRAEYELGDQLPPHVSSALNLLLFEKMEKWRSPNWFWIDKPDYDQKSKRIAEGKRDKIRQKALYVSIGQDGRVTSHPSGVSMDDANAESDLAGRYRWFVKSLNEGGVGNTPGYEKLINVVKMIFETNN